MQNKIFTHRQLGIILGDLCVVQLLAITNKICKGFDCNPPTDMRGHSLVFLKPLENDQTIKGQTIKQQCYL